MAIRSHRNLDVNRVLKKTGGRVILDILYVPRDETMLSGYQTLRAIVIWASEQEGAGPVPPDVVTVLQFLRDHWGPDEARKLAIAKHGSTRSAPSDDYAETITAEELAEILCDTNANVGGQGTENWKQSSPERQAAIIETTKALLEVVSVRRRDKSQASSVASISSGNSSSAAS